MAFKTWVDGEVLYAADLNTNFVASTLSKYNKYITRVEDTEEGLIIFGNGTHWSTTDKISTDSGATWASGGFGNANLASVSGANGIALNNTYVFTTDSGVTWSSASTAPANMSSTHSLHLFSSTIGVAGGHPSSGVSIWYTADGGDNWTVSASGPTAHTSSIQMASATIGYAVDVSGNIWKTTDAGVNWSDTGDGANASGYSQGCGISCIDTDTMIILISNTSDTCHIQHYTNSTNTVSELYRIGVGSGGDETFTFSGNSIMTADNGNIYWLLNARNVDGYWLFMWDGTHLNQRWLVAGEGVPGSEPYVATYGDFIYANLAVDGPTDVQIIAIDVRGD